MVIKVLKISFIILTIGGMVTCGQKKDVEMPEFINAMFSLDASSNVFENEGNYLPLEMFFENGELFVRYIKNGKPLDKIKLKYSHTEQLDFETTYYFDEWINGEKRGEYCFTLNSGRIQYISPQQDYVEYCIDMIVHKEDIQIETDDLFKAEQKLLQLRTDGALLEDDKYERDANYDDDYIVNFYHLIKSNPSTIDYPFTLLQQQDVLPLKMATSSDGNLRVYSQTYWLGGNINEPPIVMAQYKSGNEVNLIVNYDYWTDDLLIGDFNFLTTENEFKFGFENRTNIFTINLDGMVFYLVDITIVYGMVMMDNLTNGTLLRLYSIENGELKLQKLFNTTKKVIDEITFVYDSTKMYNENDTKDCIWHLIKYDEKSKTIFIPLITGTTLTDKYLQYKWDGKYFTYTGIE